MKKLTKSVKEVCGVELSATEVLEMISLGRDWVYIDGDENERWYVDMDSQTAEIKNGKLIIKDGA